ncbi:MAG TPA: PIG-L family deacetylase [Acidimicrobiales bacterium]
MAVHAHPDDESSSTGGVLARYSAEGFQTVVVTCTNGEFGDGPGHVKPGEPGHDEGQVARRRLAELDVACARLGVTHLELLGYHDSGMDTWEYKSRPDAFCNVALDVSAGRVADLMRRYEPDVVVTYDDRGGYNHPDHLQAHRVAVAAAERTGIPAKLYLTARPARTWARLREVLAELGQEMPARPVPDEDRRRMMEEAEQRITTAVDTSAVVERKRSALLAHASQLDESWFAKLPDDAFVELFAQEYFIRSYDRTGAAVPENDLFAGLR